MKDRLVLRLMLPFLFLIASLHAQENVGLPFLKIGAGAR